MLIYTDKVGYLLCPTEIPALMDMETRSGLIFYPLFLFPLHQGLIEIQQINDHGDFMEVCTYKHVQATLKVGHCAHPPARAVQH